MTLDVIRPLARLLAGAALAAGLAACQTASVAPAPLAPIGLGLETDGTCVYRPVALRDPQTGGVALARQRFCGGQAALAE